VKTVEYQPKNAGMAQGNSPGEDEAEQFDWEKIAGYLRFVTGAIRRRKFLFVTVLLLTGGLTYGVYWLLPRSYHVEAQLLAQKNEVISKMAGRGQQDASPTRAAAETVLRRDNLVALVQKSEVVAKWDTMRSNAARVKDWAREKLGRTTSDDEKLDMIVGTLESRLTVETKSDYGGEGTVNIALDWPDARMGYRLVNAAQQSFIEARHLSELSAISEAMSILLGRAASMREEIDTTVKKLEERKKEEKGERKRLADTGERVERRGPVVSATPNPEGGSISDKELTQQTLAMWEAKKAAIKDLQDMRSKRILELQTKLAELRATYAESHPLIVDTNQAIETLSQESPQLAELKRQEAALHSQYMGRASRMPEHTMGESLTRPIRGTSVRATAEPSTGDDRETEFTKAQLRFEAETYDGLLHSIESAHMELEAARAAFKYRYTVVKPAQIPREPEKPKPAKVLGGGFVAAVVLALLLALAADLRTGRVYERWQLERALRLPVIAEIRRD
jgi:uncharacterized protein involved in exopolysaccharide biosynthesis